MNDENPNTVRMEAGTPRRGGPVEAEQVWHGREQLLGALGDGQKALAMFEQLYGPAMFMPLHAVIGAATQASYDVVDLAMAAVRQRENLAGLKEQNGDASHADALQEQAAVIGMQARIEALEGHVRRLSGRRQAATRIIRSAQQKQVQASLDYVGAQHQQ